jgi:hypothetical protein
VGTGVGDAVGRGLAVAAGRDGWMVAKTGLPCERDPWPHRTANDNKKRTTMALHAPFRRAGFMRVRASPCAAHFGAIPGRGSLAG